MQQESHTHTERIGRALHFPPLCVSSRATKKRPWIRPAETQEVCHMQRHDNERCLGLGRPALILHGSHRELEPFKPAEDPCYHSPSEVLALPQLLKRTPQCFMDFPNMPERRWERFNIILMRLKKIWSSLYSSVRPRVAWSLTYLPRGSLQLKLLPSPKKQNWPE